MMDEYLKRLMLRSDKYLPDGLVRMDRAAIYLKSRASELFADLSARTTKGVGEYSYRITSFAREMFSLSRMAGEPILASLARELGGSNERTPRTHVISRLQEVINALEAYELEIKERDDEPLSRNDGKEGKSPKDSVSDTNAVFVIMPFRPEFNDVWNGGIKRACEDHSLNPIRVDMINRSSNITTDIVESIESCHIAIADVTDNNPNVMFELGYAIAKSKPNIIISQSSDYLPFDIRSLRTIVYTNNWSGIEDLRIKLNEFLREWRAPTKALSKHAVKKQPRKSRQ